MKLRNRLEKFHCDRRGMITIEWAMLMAAIGLPMIALFIWLLGFLGEFYAIVSFLITLPFP